LYKERKARGRRGVIGAALEDNLRNAAELESASLRLRELGRELGLNLVLAYPRQAVVLNARMDLSI